MTVSRLSYYASSVCSIQIAILNSICIGVARILGIFREVVVIGVTIFCDRCTACLHLAIYRTTCLIEVVETIY